VSDFPFLELSNDVGLIATVVLTFNLLLGMLIGVTYKRHKLWHRLPHYVQKISIFKLHNRTAYIALSLALLHPLLLLFDAKTKFKFIDIIFPINAPHQKIFVAMGTLSMFAIITVVGTSQKKVRKKLRFKMWKNIHLISYGTALLFVIHGIMLDPELKDRSVDLLDGEKLVSELCSVILIIATIIRYKYYLHLKKNRVE
jgi:DMSO/TMAO reductase YedYZ heme-binding membrane subunit